MIDHLSISVSDFAASRAFYLAALAPLGLGIVLEFSGGDGNVAYFGKEGPVIGIAGGSPVGKGTHVALRAETRAAVDAFHAAGIAAGGTDNGAPGIRTNYGPDYYAAFVRAPDGINVEVVCRSPN